MGISILEMVLATLREAGFQADTAYPGERHMHITGIRAAAHIQRVDRSAQTVAVAVDILAPENLGGAGCELAALGATEALCNSGASCMQGGCEYLPGLRVFRVEILATFACVAAAGDCRLGPGFRVWVDDTLLGGAVTFTGEHSQENTLAYELGTGAPVCVNPGRETWAITLEEALPVEAELLEQTAPFTLRLERAGGQTETYYDCRWTGETRSYTGSGLRRLRRGLALNREEGSV